MMAGWDWDRTWGLVVGDLLRDTEVRFCQESSEWCFVSGGQGSGIGAMTMD
jgi:hypothetical protein